MSGRGFDVEQEEDRVPGPRLARIGIGSVVITAIAIVVGAALLGRDQGRVGGGPAALAGHPGAIAPPAIGMIEQTLLEDPPRGVDKRAAQEERLTSYGWVDRAHEVAHIPIGRAMDLVIDEAAGEASVDGGAP
jgi:hypothetical protein